MEIMYEKKKIRLNIYKEELLVWYGRINYYVSKLNFDVVCRSWSNLFLRNWKYWKGDPLNIMYWTK